MKKYYNYIYALAADMLFWLVFAGFVSAVWKITMNRFYAFSGGRSAESLQQAILSFTPEQYASFQGAFVSFASIFFASIVVIPAVWLMLHSLSRAVIWNIITEQKFTRKKYWRWNGVDAALSLAFIIMVAVLFVVRLIVLQLATNIFYGVFLVLALAAFFIFSCTVYFKFVKCYRVWQSIGDAFGAFRGISGLKAYGIAAGVLAMLQLLQYPMRSWAFVYPVRSLLLQAVLLILYLGWLRYHVVKSFRHD